MESKGIIWGGRVFATRKEQEAYRTGIREVVEWKEETFHRYAVNRPFEEEWQAKLKEWGILLPSPELTGEDK